MVHNRGGVAAGGRVDGKLLPAPKVSFVAYAVDSTLILDLK